MIGLNLAPRVTLPTSRLNEASQRECALPIHLNWFEAVW